MDPNPFVWSVVPPEAATIGTDPNNLTDTAFAAVAVTAPDSAGNQASFSLHVTDGTLSADSDSLVPTPGIPTSLIVEVKA